MPTYEYACTADTCGHEFEQFQSFTDDALTECPVCAGRVRKVFGSVGVVFKGSGFYRNDSRESSKASATPDKAATDKGDKTEKKTDKADAGTSAKPASAGPSESKPFSAPKSAPAAKAKSPAAS